MINNYPSSRYLKCTHRRQNDFSVGEAKIGENNQDNQIQNITLCNMYLSKKVYAMYIGVRGKAPEAGEFSRILC